VRPALLGLILSLSGLPVGGAVWEDQPDLYVDAGARTIFRMSLSASTMPGATDAREYVDYPVVSGMGSLPYGSGTYGGNVRMRMVERLTGPRRVTWSIKCTSLDTSDGLTAHGRLESIRSGLGFESSRELLRALKVSHMGEAQILKIPDVVDGRETSTAVYDVFLQWIAEAIDTANPLDWIQSVEMTDRVT